MLPVLPKVTVYIIEYRHPGSHPNKLILVLWLHASAPLSIHKPIMLQTKQAEKTISLYEKSQCLCVSAITLQGLWQKLLWIILTILLSNIKRPRDTGQYPEGTLYNSICIKGKCVIHKQNQLRCSRRQEVIRILEGDESHSSPFKNTCRW